MDLDVEFLKGFPHYQNLSSNQVRQANLVSQDVKVMDPKGTDVAIPLVINLQN